MNITNRISPLKIKFGVMLRNCLRDKGVQHKEVAEHLGVSGSAVSQMLHGRIIPHARQLGLICELLQLDASLTYELQSMLTCIRTGSENMRSPFNQIFFALRTQKGYTIKALARESGISSHHLETFENCFEAIPTLDEAARLGPLLGVKPQSLLQAAGVGGLSGNAISELVDKYSSLSPKKYIHFPENIPIPQLELEDLDHFNGTGFDRMARLRSQQTYDFDEAILADLKPVCIRCPAKTLNLGIDGLAELVVIAQPTSGYRKIFLCRHATGVYQLLEKREDGYRQYRIAGTRKKLNNEVIWRLPIVKLYLKPLAEWD